MLTDRGVTELVQSGHRDEALAVVVRQLRRKVFGLAYSYLHNRDAAEDVAQEVFIKVWRALPAFDGRAALSTWVYAIARNASLSALRMRRPQVSLSDSAVAAQIDSASAATADEAQLDAAALRRLVEQLPLKQRQVVTLFYMQEQSHEEVAAMLAMPVGTVKTLLHRARDRLRQIT
ncbi:MAG TPA: sigma-70 family RNA polymerase sigma factor [Steroidobacteraceae bacterium]|nr:sigma-70 family RNA polymerase sigma factor [Steroidobacteraceae bacterium]